MKKTRFTASLIILIIIFALFVSCSGKKYERFGIGFKSEIDEIEKALDIKSGYINENDIRLICSEKGSGCEHYEIKSVRFEGKEAESLENELKSSKNWIDYPFSNEVASILVASGIPDSFDLNSIKQGYFTIAEIDKEGGSINRVNGNLLSSCKYLIVGVYDNQISTLYQIILEN